MKRILFSFLLFLFFVPKLALADEGWIIENFDSKINLQETGEVFVAETIAVDFGDLQKHGIYRDIPYIYNSDEKEDLYTKIEIKNVLQDGEFGKFKVTSSNGYVRVRIGDPDVTIVGKHTYQINYVALGVLKSFSDYDELFWNVTGNNWPVSISTVSAVVSLPKGEVLKVACFRGIFGSTDTCTATGVTTRTANFSTNDLLENEGMTLVVGYTKGIVPIVTVDRPKSLWEQFVSTPSEIVLSLVIALGTLFSLWLWWGKGRDFWLQRRHLAEKGVEEVKPMGAREQVVVEFGPPGALRPAEIGVLADERADTLDVVATIIDLAVRGFMNIKEIEKSWLFGSTDYELTKRPIDKSKLRVYEKDLLSKLFVSGDSVKLSDLKQNFYTHLSDVKKKLYEDVIDKKLFVGDPEKIRQKYLIAGVIVLALGGGLLTVGLNSQQIFVIDVGIGLMVAGFILTIVSRFMPRRSAHGREMLRRIKGYRLFINTAERYRQRFFEEKNLFTQILPYAIVFGLTDKFAKAMKDIGLEKVQPTWYTGVHPFNISTFNSSVSDFSRSVTTAIAAAPKSSGGFSSGGGFSGGGFGGGGGGSW